MTTIHLENGTQELNALIKANPGSVFLVDFHAQWCGPCKRIAPFLDELARKTGIVLVKVDVDGPNNKDVTDDFSVKAMPTLVWITPTQTKRLEGANPQAIETITMGLIGGR